MTARSLKTRAVTNKRTGTDTQRAQAGCAKESVVIPVQAHPLRVVDSITQLGATDAGCIAVSGSHGGISSARYAIAARPLLSIFNDAGVGRDEAGIAALAMLQVEGLAGCTVAHSSARIGDADSTLADGIISHLNALALGLHEGQPCSTAVSLAGADLSERRR